MTPGITQKHHYYDYYKNMLLKFTDYKHRDTPDSELILPVGYFYFLALFDSSWTWDVLKDVVANNYSSLQQHLYHVPCQGTQGTNLAPPVSLVRRLTLLPQYPLLGG